MAIPNWDRTASPRCTGERASLRWCGNGGSAPNFLPHQLAKRRRLPCKGYRAVTALLQSSAGGDRLGASAFAPFSEFFDLILRKVFYSCEGVLCVERINSFNLACIAAENGLAHVEIPLIRRRVSSLSLLSIVVSGANDLVRPTSSDGIGRAVAGDVCAAATLAVSARSPAPPVLAGSRTRLWAIYGSRIFRLRDRAPR